MRFTCGRKGKIAKPLPLKADESGMALIYTTILLPVIVGFALLAVDVGRFTTLNSSLQHGADALALAGAAELDGRPDAIERSQAALGQFVTENKALFTSSISAVDFSSISTCYLHALPASDAEPIDTDTCLSKDPADTDDQMLAKFLQVVVEPKRYDTIFPASFLGTFSNSGKTQAEAVAGFKAAVCDFTPMFICNPYEASNNTNIMEATELLKHFDRENYPDRIGRLINMKQTGGNSAQYFPGNFGFLIPQGADANPGASTLRNYVGMANPPACFVADGVQLRTGAITSVRFGFNTRFDMYDGPMSSAKSDTMYRPALNVRKGMANDKETGGGQGTACAPVAGTNPSTDPFTKLRRDNCFATNTCPYMDKRMGDGSWDRTGYWSRAHPGVSWPASLSLTHASRYDVYLYEISKDRAKDDSNGLPTGGEKGNPRCWSGNTSNLSEVPDRRIFHAAVLNCQALNASSTYGPISGGNGKKLPVVAFARFFITEPVASANATSNGQDSSRSDANVADGDVWAEMVGIDEPGNGDGVARDIVQLYR